MKNKIFLTSMLAIVVACPAFATTGTATLVGGDGFLASDTTEESCKGNALTLGNEEHSNGTFTYTAQWEPETYAVTYNPGSHGTGGYTDTPGATFGQSYSIPANANSSITANSGYTFTNAWNTAANGTGTAFTGANPWDSTSSLTVYAQYTPNTYTVTYNAGSHGTGGHTDTNGATYNQTYNIPLEAGRSITAGTGYTFNNTWNTAADGSGAAFTGADPWTRTSGLTVYAQYDADRYNVIYEHCVVPYGTSTGSYTDTNGAVYGQEYTIPADARNAIVVPTGYDFDGWDEDSAHTGAGTFTGANPWNTTSGKTVYAICTPHQHTVTYRCGGVEVTENGVTTTIPGVLTSDPNENSMTDTAIFGNPYSFSAGNICTLNGYNFRSWTCVTTPDNESVSASSTAHWNIDSNVICTASWTTNAVYLVWDTDSTDSTVTTPAACQYNATVGQEGSISPIAQPTKRGHRFTGWKVTGWTADTPSGN